MVKLSIIVPVYNVVDYIRECIDSIIIQSYDNFELILIDDGSTDGSGDICDEYSREYNQIKVIHKDNAGLSSARNAGLDVAHGEYITFIDSDDVIIGINTIENIMKCFETDSHLDVVQYKVIHKYLSQEANVRPYNYTIYSNPVDILEGYLTENIHVSCCDKIFKSKVFRNVRFPLGQISEDIYIIPDIIENVEKLQVTDIGFYGYRYRSGSISNSSLPYNKICSILSSYYRYLNYGANYEKLRPLCVKMYSDIVWSYASLVRICYPDKIKVFCLNDFYMRFNIFEYIKIIRGYSVVSFIRTYIVCVCGPQWIILFQKLFSRNK